MNEPHPASIVGRRYWRRLLVFGTGLAVTLGIAPWLGRRAYKGGLAEALAIAFIGGFIFYDRRTRRCPACHVNLGGIRDLLARPKQCPSCAPPF